MTRAGKEQLKQWLHAPLSGEDIGKRMDEVLLKFAFMETLVSLEKRLQFLQVLAQQLEESLHGLASFHKEFANTAGMLLLSCFLTSLILAAWLSFMPWRSWKAILTVFIV